MRNLGVPRVARGSATRDPRLWVGVLLVVGSGAAGNYMVQGMAHRDTAYVLVHDVAAGASVGEADVNAVSVAVPDGVVLAAQADVRGGVAARDLAAGELLTVQAVAGQQAQTSRVVTLPIKAGPLPALSNGSVVELWVTPSTQGMEIPGPAHIVVEHAIVMDAPPTIDATTDTAVTIQIDMMDVAALMTALRDGTVDVAALPGSTR